MTSGEGLSAGSGGTGIKSKARPADGMVMPPPRAEPDNAAEQAASVLRVDFRCGMCHKQCRIPCRFTGAEFRLLQQNMVNGATAVEIERIVATMGRDDC